MSYPQIINPELAREQQGDREVKDVAVGILIRETDAAFLLTSRPDGKPYAGYWEFPGGKLELGESTLDALQRELQEELGIQVEEALLWMHAMFDYPHAIVRLHFYKVTKWSGVIEMRECQEHCWSQLPVTVSPVLPGTLPVLDWFSQERSFSGATVVSPAA